MKTLDYAEVFYRSEGEDWSTKHEDPVSGDNVRIVYNRHTKEVVSMEHIVVTESGKYDKR